MNAVHDDAMLHRDAVANRVVGRDRRLPEIMPYLVQAMFTNSPGESGVTKEVVIRLPDRDGRH